MISGDVFDGFAHGLRFAIAPFADREIEEPVAALATAFEQAGSDTRRLVLEGLDHEVGGVRGLAALLSICAFGATQTDDFLRVCDAFLPSRTDRLALLTYCDPSSVGLLFTFVEAAAYGPVELCRSLEELALHGQEMARGWSALALGFLADDVPRAVALLTQIVAADPARFVVAAAMFGLATADDFGEVPEATLRTVALSDPDGRVRAAAYRLIGICGGDVASAFSDVETVALTGALDGRALSGRAALSDDELRRVRARLRQRPVDESAAALVMALYPQIELGVDLLRDLEEFIARLPAAAVASVSPLIETTRQLVDSDALGRLAAALSARAEATSE